MGVLISNRFDLQIYVSLLWIRKLLQILQLLMQCSSMVHFKLYMDATINLVLPVATHRHDPSQDI
jgi:hypothetical protein